MKNIEYIKKMICDEVNKMSPEEIYIYLLDNNLLLIHLCIICKNKYGICEADMDDDSVCIKRFTEMCDSEIDDEQKQVLHKALKHI